MVRLLAVLLLAGVSVNGQTITETFGSGANQFSVDFVEIGNPGNPSRTYLYGSWPDSGGVDYVFNLGKFEISRDQIEKANADGGLGITLFDMTDYGGNGANRPATGISWSEAARFVNFLNTSQGKQAAYSFDESGKFQLWTSAQSGYNPNNPYRNSNAFYFLPSRDEWFKGAFYDPNKPGGPGYWDYPTGSDSVPLAVSGGTSGVVYNQNGPFFTTSPADVTNAGGLSPYGTMAQGGNAPEIIETAFDLSNDSATEMREISGGSWNISAIGFYSGSEGMRARYGLYFEDDYDVASFRVAMVPEPSSLSLLLAGSAVLMVARKKR